MHLINPAVLHHDSNQPSMASMEIDQQPRLFYDFDLRFPPLSRTVAEVSSLLGANGMPDTDRLLDIVHMDPLVVASVLKRINSAFYGMRQQFQDIRKAILMIGFIEVCNIVLASGYVGLRKEINSDLQVKIIDRIMRVSIGSGFFANLISQHLRLPDKSSAFTAGLLHNVGRFVLLYNLPEAYEKLYTGDRKSYIPSSEDEVQSMGIDHCSIGALAAQHWNFPELIVSLIESYQTPGQLTVPDHRTAALALSASSSIAQQLCASFDTARKNAATPSNEESEGDALDGISFPMPIQFPDSFSQLAQHKHQNPEELQVLINDNQADALKYIDMMMNV